MEHRIGQRYPTEVSVYIRTVGSKLHSRGTLCDLSISGGFIRTSLLAEPLCEVIVQLADGNPSFPAMTAQVVRRTVDGLGVEWAEYATELVWSLTRPPLQQDRLAG